MMNTKTEEIVMSIIASSGDARSDLMGAIKSASDSNFEEAEMLNVSGKEKLSAAHKIHTEIIQKEAMGENLPYSMLLCHAQDHLMTTSLLGELSEEFISLNKRLALLETCGN